VKRVWFVIEQDYIRVKTEETVGISLFVIL